VSPQVSGIFGIRGRRQRTAFAWSTTTTPKRARRAPDQGRRLRGAGCRGWGVAAVVPSGGSPSRPHGDHRLRDLVSRSRALGSRVQDQVRTRAATADGTPRVGSPAHHSCFTVIVVAWPGERGGRERLLGQRTCPIVLVVPARGDSVDDGQDGVDLPGDPDRRPAPRNGRPRRGFVPPRVPGGPRRSARCRARARARILRGSGLRRLRPSPRVLVVQRPGRAPPTRPIPPLGCSHGDVAGCPRHEGNVARRARVSRCSSARGAEAEEHDHGSPFDPRPPVHPHRGHAR
jgi:hypothetical protein